MKRFASLVAVLGMVTGFSSTFAATYTWDDNGTSPSFFTSYADGTWSTSATQWTTDPTGIASPIVWADSNNAVFSINNASGTGGADVDALVDVPAAVSVGAAGSMSVDGWLALGGAGTGNVTIGTGGLTINPNSKLTLHAIPVADAVLNQYPGVTQAIPENGGAIAMGTNKITIKSGGVVSINNVADISFTAGASPGAGGGVILDGGTFSSRQPTTTSSSYAANMSITIAANSGIGYIDMPDPAQTTGPAGLWNPAANVGIYGEGGTTTNGGAGTLVKKGAGEFRPGSAGAGFTFAKLWVDGSGITNNTLTSVTAAGSNTGEYRVGNTPTNETIFGAVPLAPLADAIKLTNGGMIGTNVTMLLHPNRGVTIGATGGGTWVTGNGLVGISGVLSGSGPLLFNGYVGAGSISLDNPNNTWSGDLIMRNGSLIANQNVVANHIEGENQGFSGTTPLFGLVNIAPGKSLTVGSDNLSTQFDGRVTGGAGTFNKEGTGILTLDTFASAAEWTNLGTANINNGQIKLATANAGFGDATRVKVATGATLDMNAIEDGFGGLDGSGSVLHTATPTASGPNLTLRGAGTYNFFGVISGQGKLVYSGAPTLGFAGTQTLTGENTYTGATEVKGGRLIVNNAPDLGTTGSGTGTGAVTITGGLLAGSGDVDGAITVGTGSFGPYGPSGNTRTVTTAGHLGAGEGLGDNTDLTANSTLTINSGGVLEATLGDPNKSDRVKVTTAGAVTINAGGMLTLNGASSAISGTYTVFEHNGLAAGAATDLTLNNATGFDLASATVTDTGTAFTVSLTNTVQNRSWALDGNGNWSAATGESGNWSGGAGGQANGPGAVASFGATGGATTHTVTITDSNKTLGVMNLNSDNYTIAATALTLNRLVMDTYGANAQINVAAGTHTITASLATKKKTDVNVASGLTLAVSGGVINDAGVDNVGAGTLAISSADYVTPIINNSTITNSSSGTLTIGATGTNNSFINHGTVTNSGTGGMTITGAIANPGSVINTSNTGTVTVSAAVTTSAVAYGNAIFSTALPGTNGKFINSGSGTMTISGAITNAGGVRFSNSTTGTMTVSGVISGGVGLGDSGKVYIDGPGTVVLSGVNTFGGGTILQSGKLQISTELNLGGAPTVAGGFYNNITIDGGTLLTVPTAALTINTNRGIFMKGNGGIETAGTFDVSFAGLIHGTGILTKTGTKTLTLTGESITYGGNIAVNNGVLAASSAFSLGTTAGNTTVANNAALNTSGTATIAEQLFLNGTGIANDGALRHISGAKALTGAITLASSGVRINADAGTLSLAGGVTGAGNPNLTMGGAGAITVQTVAMNIGTGTFTKDGVGTVNLNIGSTMGNSTQTSGRVNIGATNALGTTGTLTISPTAAISMGANVVGPCNLPNNIVSNVGTNVYDLIAATGRTINLNGQITGAGPFTRGAAGSTADQGTYNLNGDNSGWSGGMTINQGIVGVGNKNGLGSNILLVNPIGTNATIGLKPQLQASAALTGANAIANNITINNQVAAATPSFTGMILGGTNSFDLTGQISDGTPTGGSIDKQGASIVTLTGNNNYSGGTTVTGGTLLIKNTSGSGTGSGPVSVGSGAILGGTGTISGAVTNNGTVAPGASIGTLTTGALTMGNGSHLAIELGAGSTDLLTVNGALDLSSLTDILDFSGTLTGAGPFTFATYTGSIGSNVFDVVNNTPAGYHLDYATASQIRLVANVTAGDWNGDGLVNAGDYVTWRKDETGHGGVEGANPSGYVTWRGAFSIASELDSPPLGGTSAVPEPTSLALLLVGVAAMATRRRVR